MVTSDREHSATKVTPFYTDNGHHPYKGTSPKVILKNELAQEFADKMKKIQEEVESTLKKTASDMSHYYNRHQRESAEYKVGNKFWLEGTNLNQ